MNLNLAKSDKLTLTVQEFQADYYALIKSWWDQRNFSPPPFEYLPPTGFLISFKGQPLAAGFLFKTDSNVAVISHLVSDPGAPKMLRQPSIDFLVEHLTSIAKEADFTLLCCSTNIEKLGARFEAMGFYKTDTGVTMYAKGI